MDELRVLVQLREVTAYSLAQGAWRGPGGYGLYTCFDEIDSLFDVQVTCLVPGKLESEMLDYYTERGYWPSVEYLGQRLVNVVNLEVL